MHPVLRHFIRQYILVTLATLMPVVAIAFVSMPLSLGGHPGEIRTASATVERHLT